MRNFILTFTLLLSLATLYIQPNFYKADIEEMSLSKDFIFNFFEEAQIDTCFCNDQMYLYKVPITGSETENYSNYKSKAIVILDTTLVDRGTNATHQNWVEIVDKEKAIEAYNNCITICESNVSEATLPSYY